MAKSLPPKAPEATRRELANALGGAGIALLAFSITMCTGGVASRPAEAPRAEPDSTNLDSKDGGSEARLTQGASDGSPLAAEAGPGAKNSESTSTGAESSLAIEAKGPLPLGRFYAALRGLGLSKDPQLVRVAWLGDSHTAADFWSQVVRSGLQSNFGNGGPGLLHLGLKVYRHGAASVVHEGKWGLKPKAPGFFEPQGDGVFGLGGMVTLPRSNDATARVELPSGLSGKVLWHVVYRLPEKHSRFTIKLGETVYTVDGPNEVSAAGISHRTFEADARQAFQIIKAVAEPEFFGVIGETAGPGVVIDTLGINGARLATAVSWNREAWIEELKSRAPQLVIIAYGSNEVGDAHAPRRYEAQYQELVDRIRTAAPGADCLIMGPSERDLPDWTTNPRVFEIEDVQRQAAQSLGCAFFSVLEAMGGAGTLRKWAFSKPSLARKDRVHLTAAGYHIVGEKLLDGLKQSFIATHPDATWP